MRERYENNPLAEVSCEVKFPVLLKLVQQGPVELQDVLKDQFPMLSVVDMAPVLQVRGESDPPPFAIQRRYVFKTTNGHLTVTVGADTLFLTTSDYRRWEDFRSTFLSVLEQFINTYKPPQILRIGLRYIDVIDPKVLGSSGEDFRSWISPALLGLLNDPDLSEDDALEMQNYSLVRISPRGKLGIRSGFAFPAAPDFGTSKVFILDGDFHEDTGIADMGPTEICSVLNDFNYQAGGLFQWAFLPALREKLLPLAVQE